jgi:hypothetical protein
MAGLTTAMPSSFKQELMSAGHCFNATTSGITANGVSGAFTLTSMSSMSGVAVGMAASGTNVASGAVVASIDSATQVTLSKAHTGTITGGTITFTGDQFKMALVKHGPAGTYGAGSVNYTDVTGNSDEVSGTGYTAGGTALTNVSAVLSGTTAYINFGGTISWTSATIDADGCVIQNTSVRNGGTSGTNTQGGGRLAYVGDFGGEQKVTSGTFTVVMPSATSSTAILRLA